MVAQVEGEVNENGIVLSSGLKVFDSGHRKTPEANELEGQELWSLDAP